MKILKKIFRNHLVHFILIGFGLFILDQSVIKHFRSPEREPIRISAAQIETIRADFVKQVGRSPSSDQLSALVRDAIDEEILVREARHLLLDKGDESVRLRLIGKMRALGEGERYSSEEELLRKAYDLKLDNDTVVRRHLVHKMQILLAGSVNSAPPTDNEIQKYLADKPQQYELSPKVTFAQVFVNSQSRQRAQSILKKIRASTEYEKTAESLSDPFPLDLNLNAISESLLRRRFGKTFAQEVFAAQPGEWIGPIESPYGLHLIHVLEKQSKQLPALADLRQLVARDISKVKVAGLVEEAMDHLRKLYPAEVEWNLKGTANASL